MGGGPGWGVGIKNGINMLSLLKHSISIQVTIIAMEKTILDLLDTGSPLTVKKFLQDLEILETNKQCPTCSLPMKFIEAPQKLDQCGYVCKNKPFKNRLIYSLPKQILINSFLCQLWKIMKIQV